ncbi:hypothetical protein INT48_000397 [Thamnidium elegans]|uniref:Uncharacterized protein n=1 Tax=Thamnidium elegans TaxID=101142 RepID=A0A8H7VZZ0_9FUNG|nr:hypothetical protein INT48_000397 [Thamnidium elegans]
MSHFQQVYTAQPSPAVMMSSPQPYGYNYSQHPSSKCSPIILKLTQCNNHRVLCLRTKGMEVAAVLNVALRYYVSVHVPTAVLKGAAQTMEAVAVEEDIMILMIADAASIRI